MQLTVRGVVTTTAMAHQSYPVNDNSRRGVVPQATTNLIANGRFLRGVPFISAESVRGMIRRAACDVIFDVLKAKGEKVSRNLYLSLVRGSFARRGLESGGATINQLIQAYSHTFAGVFGGGAWMLRSSFRMERDLLPVIQATSNLFPALVQGFALDVAPRDLMMLKVMAPRDDFARLPLQAQENVADLQNAYTQHMSTKVQQAAAKKDDASESKDDLDNFGLVECIIPGVPLYFGARADNVTEAQAGLLLMAIYLWCNRNGLGGGNARGRGTFIPSLSVTIDGETITNQFVSGDAPCLKLSDHSAMSTMVKSMGEALEIDASADALSAVFPTEIRSNIDKAPKSAGKAKKAGAETTVSPEEA